jgi:transposase-like protein
MIRAELYERAEAMYVSQDMTFAEIASKFDCAERTLRLWAEEGGWQKRRVAFRAQREGLHEKLYKFTNDLMENVQKAWADGEQVDPGRLYALTRLIDKLDKAKQFDSEVAKEKKKAQSESDQGGLSEEAIRLIEQQLKLL